MNIKQEFLACLSEYSAEEERNERLWAEIQFNYSTTGRHYHTLTHLSDLASELSPFRERFESWAAAIFAIVYHDAIYNVHKNNNEEKSAELARLRLGSLSVPGDVVDLCAHFIVATKNHQSVNPQTDLFTDADLSKLGAEEQIYDVYSLQIREEYSIYPDLIYNPGRKKVLNHFLGMARIFKTDDFHSRYEKNARKNLTRELARL